MIETDKPIVDMLTLRRDLYLVMSLLLADKEVAKVKNSVDWTRDFYENEVRRLLLWIAIAIRGLLDLSKRSDGNQMCGEYWQDFPNQENPEQLTIRQACNSIIHAKAILNYKIPEIETDQKVVRIYKNRITIKSTHRKKKTHAELDIVRFVQGANTLANSFMESEDAN